MLCSDSCGHPGGVTKPQGHRADSETTKPQSACREVFSSCSNRTSEEPHQVSATSSWFGMLPDPISRNQEGCPRGWRAGVLTRRVTHPCPESTVVRMREMATPGRHTLKPPPRCRSRVPSFHPSTTQHSSQPPAPTQTPFPPASCSTGAGYPRETAWGQRR